MLHPSLLSFSAVTCCLGLACAAGAVKLIRWAVKVLESELPKFHNVRADEKNWYNVKLDQKTLSYNLGSAVLPMKFSSTKLIRWRSPAWHQVLSWDQWGYLLSGRVIIKGWPCTNKYDEVWFSCSDAVMVWPALHLLGQNDMRWFVNGKTHRLNGPCVISGSCKYGNWSQRNKFHRTDGSSFYMALAGPQWTLNGVTVTRGRARWEGMLRVLFVGDELRLTTKYTTH